MKLLVFGAAGASGRLVVRQARDAGHDVTAFVRDPGAKVEGVRVVAGDATDAAAVDAVMAGQEAVISTLGRRNSFSSEALIERSFAAIVPAMERAGAGRLVVMSALGVGATRSQAPLVPRAMYRLLLTDIFGDKDRGERLVEASALDWTCVHPPLLTDGPASGHYRVGETLALTGFPKVARADVAHFLVSSLASRRWIRKHVIVTG